MRATIISASAGGTSLTVRVPACVAQGQVPVSVELDNGIRTPALTATYTSSSANPGLQPYEAVTVPAAQVGQCLSLLGNGARYVVVPQYATPDLVPGSVAGSRPGYVLGAAGAATPVAALASLTQPLGAQARLDRLLRGQEHALAPLAALSGAHPATGLATLDALDLNSTRSVQGAVDAERWQPSAPSPAS